MLDQLSQFVRIFLNPLGQAGHLDAVGTKPIIKILAKCPRASQFFSRPIGRRHDTPKKPPWFVAADRRKRPFFKHFQELDLDLGGHFTDFVEKNRPVRPAQAE